MGILDRFRHQDEPQYAYIGFAKLSPEVYADPGVQDLVKQGIAGVYVNEDGTLDVMRVGSGAPMVQRWGSHQVADLPPALVAPLVERGFAAPEDLAASERRVESEAELGPKPDLTPMSVAAATPAVGADLGYDGLER